MLPKMQNIHNYVGYTKCGEVLRPPSAGYQHPYILKCYQCSEIYLLYEAFIFHMEDHCKSLNMESQTDVDSNISKSAEGCCNQDHKKFVAKAALSIKAEANQSSTLTEDPLINPKREHISHYGLPSLLEVEVKPVDFNADKSIQKIKHKTLSTVKEFGENVNSKERSIGEKKSNISDEEMENSSDGGTYEEDDEYEIRMNKQSNNDLTLIQSAPDYDFLKTKKYINSLIEAYKNQPTLWNKNFPFLRHKLKRQNCYQEIANELKRQHYLSITWNQAANAIVFLCRKYREDLKSLMENNETKETYTPSWFFQNLNFLKPFAENNQIVKLDSHLPDLLPYQIKEILGIYKGLPHLWNTEMIEHYCKNKTDAAKQEMLNALYIKLGIKITVNVLEEYFRTINNCFARAKRKKSDTKANKMNSDVNTEDYYEPMLFLTDHVGSFSCSECTRCFKSPMYLKIHQTQAHKFEPLPCSLCHKKFRSVSSYTNHAKRHMKDLNHECKECDKKFLQSNELQIHMRNHTGVKPFCCEICGASFRHVQSFTIHHRRHIKKYLHSCEICGKGFYTKDRYKDHINSHSNTRNQVCKVCGKTFITKRTLRQHVVIHEDVRTHACKLCGKAFKHKTGVTQHMKTHGITNNNEKKYVRIEYSSGKMQTKVQNMQKYVGYTKCGEILKPPSGSYQRPYILKCFHCKEIYLLFEAFIFHIEDHCKSLIAETRANNEYIDESFESNSNSEHMELSDKTISIKVEDIPTSMQTDPLIVVKPERFSENYNTIPVKEEIGPLDNISSVLINNDYKEKLPPVEELCDAGFNENLNNCDEEDYQSSGEEVESRSDDATSVEYDDCGIMFGKETKRDLVSSIKLNSFVKKFLQTKKHVLSFIEAYKNQPSLWNKNFPCLRYKEKRQNCLQKIADELNKQHKLSLTWNQIASVIIFLCRTYREDLKGFKERGLGVENYKPSWFFEDLHFLKPFMENNQIAKLDSHMPDLLPYQVIELLRIYKDLPHIWNTDMIEHYCKNKVDAAKKEMLQTLEKNLGLKITENILENYFRTVNNCFTRAKRKKINEASNKNEDEANIEDNMLEDYYEHMLFLNDHVGSFKCSECKRSFKSPMYLKIHQTNAHGFEPIQCSQCKKPFKSITAYTNHAKRHMEDLNHECEECGKKFLHSTDLRIHMRNHTGVKPFCCEICGASFRHIQGFTNHHRRHIKNYLHTCEICGKGFYSKDRYNDHMNSHSNTRNQVCKVCGKAFITKRSLQQHVVIHDNVRRYSCKLCGKSFKQKTGVNQHMRTHGIANSEEKTATKKE